MKKLLTVCLAALLCAAVTACGGSTAPASSAASSAPAASAPASSTADAAPAALPEKLVMGLDASFPPMGFMDQNNQIIGVDIDLARAVCEKLGIGFEPKPIDWDAKDMELTSDKINCIWNGMTITDERIASYEMSPAYMDNEQVIVVMQDSPIKAKADLADKIVAAQKDSSGLTALQGDAIFASIKGGEAKEYANYVDAMTDLEIGRCDAIVMDSIVANYYITMNAKSMVVLTETMSSEKYGIGFKKGNTALKDAVWGALQELEQEGKIAEISNQWFGKDDMIVLE